MGGSELGQQLSEVSIGLAKAVGLSLELRKDRDLVGGGVGRVVVGGIEELDYCHLGLPILRLDYKGCIWRVVVGKAEPVEKLRCRIGADLPVGPVREIDGMAEAVLED